MISRETHARVLGHHMLGATPKRTSDSAGLAAGIIAATLLWVVIAWIINTQ